MNAFSTPKSKSVNSRNILGGIPGLFDADFEKETSSITKGVSGIFQDIISLGQDITGVESKTESSEATKFPPQGTIEFNKVQAQIVEDQKQKEGTVAKKAFFQALKEDITRVENARDRMIYEEEIADIGVHISTEEKNRLLHYQAGYKDRSIYQMAELRRKMIEQRKKSDGEKQDASLAQTQTKGKSAMQGIFEGSSGSQGGGTSNLSAQAVG